MSSRCVIMIYPDGTEEEFSSIRNAAKFLKLIGVSDKKIHSISTRINQNAMGKSKKVYRQYEFRYKTSK